MKKKATIVSELPIGILLNNFKEFVASDSENKPALNNKQGWSPLIIKENINTNKYFVQPFYKPISKIVNFE